MVEVGTGEGVWGLAGNEMGNEHAVEAFGRSKSWCDARDPDALLFNLKSGLIVEWRKLSTTRYQVKSEPTG